MPRLSLLDFVSSLDGKVITDNDTPILAFIK